ncbi:MAG: hypothetical protein AMXMBFR66_21420 [Pseudomonadota bacterium]|nr:hypothetical protein [Comamonadaceae bacterium]
MVGVVVGLFVVAAASLIVSGQLGENRRLLLDTQLQQDLRATADIVARELRRIGAWNESWRGIVSDDTPAAANALNTTSAPANVATNDVNFSYQRTTETGGWRFRLVNGVVRTTLGPNMPEQDLTDGNVMVVDSFQVTREPLTTVRIPCPKLCQPGNTVDCWPEQTVNEFVVEITAHARADDTVRRSIRSRVRQRNDKVQFNVAGAPPQACPS